MPADIIPPAVQYSAERRLGEARACRQDIARRIARLTASIAEMEMYILNAHGNDTLRRALEDHRMALKLSLGTELRAKEAHGARTQECQERVRSLRVIGDTYSEAKHLKRFRFVLSEYKGKLRSFAKPIGLYFVKNVLIVKDAMANADRLGGLLRGETECDRYVFRGAKKSSIGYAHQHFIRSHLLPALAAFLQLRAQREKP